MPDWYIELVSPDNLVLLLRSTTNCKQTPSFSFVSSLRRSPRRDPRPIKSITLFFYFLFFFFFFFLFCHPSGCYSSSYLFPSGSFPSVPVVSLISIASHRIASHRISPTTTIIISTNLPIDLTSLRSNHGTHTPHTHSIHTPFIHSFYSILFYFILLDSLFLYHFLPSLPRFSIASLQDISTKNNAQVMSLAFSRLDAAILSSVL